MFSNFGGFPRKASFASRFSTAPISAMLFDFDDVLMVTEDNAHKIFEIMFVQMEVGGHKRPNGISFKDKRSEEKSVDFLTRVYADPVLGQKAYDIVETLYYQTEIPAVEGAAETLRLLKQNNTPFAIVSNLRNELLEYRFKRLFGEFEGTVVLGQSRKPEPDNIHRALEILGITDPKEVLFVGDKMDTDVKAAIAAGCHPVFFGPIDFEGVKRIKEETGYKGPVGWVSNHQELRELIIGRSKSKPPPHPR